MSTLPKIVYSDVAVLFDRGVNVWNLSRDQRRVENESASGIIETLSYYERERVAIQRRIASADLQAQLEQFWAYAKSGQSFSFWRDRDLAGYWDFEGKSYASNDGVAGTFARATTAYYTDPADGLVKSVASGTARFPAGKFGRGFLSESAATNLLVRSEELDNASWAKTTVTVSANTTETKDPNGGTTAEKCEPSAATGSLQQDTSTNISTNDAVFTVYIKGGKSTSTSATIKIIRVDTSAVLATSTVTITRDWQRFRVSYDNAGSITANWGVVIDLSGNVEVFYTWGADLKVSSNMLFATSYIPTTSAAVTRNVDNLVFVASNFFNDEPRLGTIMLWFAPLFAQGLNSDQRNILNVDNVAAGTWFSIDFTTGHDLQCTITPNYGSAVVLSHTAAPITANAFVHIAVTFDFDSASAFKLYYNGTLVDTDTLANLKPYRIGTNLQLSSNGACGVYDEIEIRKDVLTAQQISNYYNSARARGWRRNYFSSMIIDQDNWSPELGEGGWRFNIPIVMKEVLT